MSALPLTSYKLRFFEDHVRAVPATDGDGCPFKGPGVDLRGDKARPILAAAAPMVAWLDARDPGIVLRSLSVDCARQRILITSRTEGEPPRVIRLDPPYSSEILDVAKDLERLLGEACRAALAARS